MTSQTATRPLWIGTFPAEGGDPGGGEGIWRVDVDVATGRFGQHRLVVSVPSPTFLALHPTGRVLYAVSETDPGTLSAFTVSGDGALVPAGSAPSGGSHPCHVLAQAGTVWLANYADGVAAALPVGADGP